MNDNIEVSWFYLIVWGVGFGIIVSTWLIYESAEAGPILYIAIPGFALILFLILDKLGII